MKRFDWKLTIKMNISLMKVSGLWPSGDESYKPNFYTLYASVLLTLLLLGHVFFQFVYVFLILDDLQAVTATSFLLLTEMLIILKTYCLIRNMGMLKRLMATLDSDLFQPKSTEQILLVKPSLKFWKRIYNIFWSMALSAIFFWSAFPILDNSFKDYRLPFFAWYPYDTKASPFYEITYIYQIICICFAALVDIGIDTLIAALNMYTGTQFDLLCDDLRNLHDPDEVDVSKKLIACIRHHKEILSFASNSNKFFNWIIFLQFFVSAVSIGLTMFQLTVVASFTNEFYSIMFYFNAAVVEIFMYCWFGNEVEIKSSKISYAVFECDWINMSQKTKNAMTIFVLRCHRPLKISTLNLFYLSLDTFVKM
ncbi:7tm 6 domain containing protein [Asbolus verrucosus]|uniref:Odorant receptor n=1 Tax=Asbolus verrucosus TaxID=1661398 RepID=A0A482VKL0_ASBVE|nr:7tm 6 domain containing protein [Asbolus verrucosus]